MAEPVGSMLLFPLAITRGAVHQTRSPTPNTAIMKRATTTHTACLVGSRQLAAPCDTRIHADRLLVRVYSGCDWADR
jgi:hypothetical protein